MDSSYKGQVRYSATINIPTFGVDFYLKKDILFFQRWKLVISSAG
jgi:hypothetical protein